VHSYNAAINKGFQYQPFVMLSLVCSVMDNMDEGITEFMVEEIYAFADE
jgi:hypothetical protein